MTSILRQLQNEWNALVPVAQERGFRRVRILQNRLERISHRREKLEWLRAQLNSSTAFDTLTFGVELECILPAGFTHSTIARLITEAGVGCNAEQYNHTARAAWKVVADGSLGDYSRGCEIVSPPMSGEQGFAQIRKVCAVLVANRVRITKKCGFHVHVGIASESLTTLKNLVRTYSGSDAVINGLVSPSRRHNPYCGAIRINHAAVDAANDMDSLVRAIGQIPGERYVRSSSRYAKVNLQSYYQHRTVEFRQHQGTVEGAKVENWVRLCLRMVVASRAANAASQDLSTLLATLNASDTERQYFTQRAAQFAQAAPYRRAA